jgi:hypothetical protein
MRGGCSDAAVEGTANIFEKVAGIFDANAQSHKTLGDAAGLAHRGRDACVRHRCGVADERFDATERLSEGDDFERCHELFSLLAGAKFDRDHSGKAAHLASGKLVLRMGRQSWVIDLRDCWMLLAEFGNRKSILLVLFHSHCERFDRSQQEPAVEGTRNRTGGILEEVQTLCKLGGTDDDDAMDQVGMSA